MKEEKEHKTEEKKKNKKEKKEKEKEEEQKEEKKKEEEVEKKGTLSEWRNKCESTFISCGKRFLVHGNKRVVTILTLRSTEAFE